MAVVEAAAACVRRFVEAGIGVVDIAGSIAVVKEEDLAFAWMEATVMMLENVEFVA